MPQFDFFTAFNQIWYGSFGFFAIFLLLSLSGPWNFLLSKLSLPSHENPSYLEFFHATLLARKIKLFFAQRFSFVIVYYAYFSSLGDFVSSVNWVSNSISSISQFFISKSKVRLNYSFFEFFSAFYTDFSISPLFFFMGYFKSIQGLEFGANKSNPRWLRPRQPFGANNFTSRFSPFPRPMARRSFGANNFNPIFIV